MKKELKQYIKANKLSDDDILKLISVKPSPPAESEKDVKDEEDESEESDIADDSEDQQEAESPAATEPSTKLDPDDIKKLIAEEIGKAMKQTRTEIIKKIAPRPTQTPAQTAKPNQFGIRDR